MKTEMKTVYAKCWEHYKLSKEYGISVDVMQRSGLKFPYIDNILRTAFDFAWNSKKEIYSNKRTLTAPLEKG